MAALWPLYGHCMQLRARCGLQSVVCRCVANVTLEISPIGDDWPSAVGEPTDQLQAGPGRVDRAHLHVDHAQRKRELADPVLVEVGRHPGRPLRPRGPDHPGGRGLPQQHGQPLREGGPVGTEHQHDVVRRTPRPASRRHTRRQTLDDEAGWRVVDQHQVLRFDPELGSQRLSRVTGCRTHIWMLVTHRPSRLRNSAADRRCLRQRAGWIGGVTVPRQDRCADPNRAPGSRGRQRLRSRRTDSGKGHTDQMALTDEAIVKIKEMITSGELGPGDRLPKEADLAARLGLSRNSLREAVKALTLVNVLDVRHGDGTYVSSLDSAHLLDALNFMVDLHRDDSVLQFFEVRRLLEPGVAALAATRISLEQATELRLLTSDPAPDASVEELVENDLQFHRGIAEATGNQVVCSLLDGISGATQRARIWRGVTQAGAVERPLAEHAAILDAIEIGDAEAARAWMTAHIAGVETWLRKAP